MEPAWILATLTAAGGTFGYARKRSIPSLAAGLIIGGTFAYSGYIAKENDAKSSAIALSASAVMLTAGLLRGIPSRFAKPVPIVLSVLGAVGVAYYGFRVSRHDFI
ncbi:HHR221Cp [Eremothecium sinecaudum]|uniref:HHR221Cp n=1 Tax=Eremothecium sinecaudum TaxID=45286 RepID=A0A0X8HWY2_9SACH|nr:HHR221Cp [Eremothecium sinecaudum]AMD22990.1 HHR221Cp [Eremothecium sinecaudum]